MGWFEKELNYARGRYDDDDTTDIDITPKTSLTGRLWDYMGPSNWGWSTTKDDPSKESRDKIQREVAGTVNLLNNSTDGNEKSLKLGFANNHDRTNDIASDTVLMPADIVDQTGSEEDAIDVMSGMALIASTMKTTVDFHAYSDATIATGGHEKGRQPSSIKGGHYIWTALEQAIARRAVSDKWPGFDSYFDAHRNHCSSVEGKDIDTMLEADKANGVKGGISRRTAMVAAAYNTLNPRDAKLMSDSRMRKAMNLIADLALEGEKRDRFNKSVNIADFINRSFDKEEEEEDQEKQPDEDSSSTPEGGKPDGGNGDKSDEDKSEDKDDGKEDSKEDGDGEGDDPFGDLPAQADSTLFGEQMDEVTGDEELPRSVDELTLPDVSTREGGPMFIRTYGYAKAEVKKRAGEYRKMVNESKGEIKAVINSLLFMNNHPESHIHGMRHGSLDPGSLHKLAIDTDNPTVFEQVENITGKRIAVSLLVDRSGSMCSTSTRDKHGSSESTRQQDANRVAMILIEALSKIDGIELNVHTHCTFPHADCSLKQEIATGHAGMASDDMTIHNIVTEDDDARQMLVDLQPGGNNLDGYAIKHIAEGMSKDYHDHDERVLFVISDGQPHACNYGFERAMGHVGDCCSFSRAIYGTKVYGIGIANAFSQEDGEMMYGEGNFIVLKDVTPSIKVMTSFLRKVAVKQ